ncbi:hypothetical protein [Glycomyces buryatensis]|uniref:Uncharacterized protein n=1 Tax=Glycomyces buryatensis TaxID=2570927 RepID=A0A4V4HSZ0_9ACTN|nr:hypothetical protein [Glycomyces buryatensis]THV43526.1 hypothetical protein FAB82_00220 [Glycomyces buryatensis]
MSIGQVLAATGATTIGAILVKLLDIWGTILGTAVLSVCTSIGAVLILRAVNRTGDKLKAQLTAMVPAARRTGAGQDATIPLDPNHVAATAAIPTAAELAALDDETAEIPKDPEEVPVPEGPEDPEEHISKRDSRKRTLIAILISSVLVFGLTFGALYLLGTLTGEPGRFVLPAPQETTTTIIESPSDDSDAETPGTDTGGSATPSDEASESPVEEAPTTGGETPSEDEATSSEPAEEEETTGSGGSEDPTVGQEDLEQELTPSESAS